jgi:hypothetical protein
VCIKDPFASQIVRLWDNLYELRGQKDEVLKVMRSLAHNLPRSATADQIDKLCARERLARRQRHDV